jgi:hypothetical protein
MSDRKIPLIAAIVAAGALFTGSAHAGSHVNWSVSVNAPAVTTTVSNARGYYAEPAGYYQPAPVYYQRAPVYYQPAPVYHHPPAIAGFRHGPAWGYRADHRHHHHHRHDGWRDGGRRDDGRHDGDRGHHRHDGRR